jgi:hypothetical protein
MDSITGRVERRDERWYEELSERLPFTKTLKSYPPGDRTVANAGKGFEVDVGVVYGLRLRFFSVLAGCGKLT